MTLAPFDRLSGAVSGGGLAFRPADGVEVAVSAFANIAEDQAAETALQKVEISKDLLSNVELRLGLGLLQEQGGFLGATSSGVFGKALTSRSQFADLAIIARISERIDWFGSYSRGRSSIESDRTSLLSDWSSVSTEAFGTGLSIRDLSVGGDSLSLMIGQPFRGDHVSTTLTVPVGRTPGGAVVTERQRINLAPSAREITSEATYRWPLDRGGTKEIRAGGFARFNPGHDADKSPEFGLGLHYRWQF